MIEPQDPIEAVLHAIAHVEPSSSFEARMQHTLHSAAQPAAKQSLRTRFAIVTTLLVILVIAVGLATHQRHRTHSPAALEVPDAHAIATNYAATKTLVQTLPPRTPHIRTPKLQAVSAPTETATMTHKNIPEPLLPLTAEERSVLHMMRRNQSPQLAQLSPDARAQSLRDDAAAYNDFFAPPPPLSGQPIYVQPPYEQHIISGGSQ